MDKQKVEKTYLLDQIDTAINGAKSIQEPKPMTERQAIKEAIISKQTHDQKAKQFEMERLNEIFDLEQIKEKWGQSAMETD